MKKYFSILLALIMLTGLTGCDQLSSFLSDYFPSQKKEVATVKKTPVMHPKAPVTMTANTVAKVGDWTITAEEFKQRIAGLKEAFPDFDENSLETRTMILEELVRQQLLVEAAQKQGLGDTKEVRDALEEFRKSLLVQELVKNITQNVEVTEQDARTFYEENADLFEGDPEWRIRELVVSEEAKAKELLVNLLQGADFAMVAQMNSIADTAAQGGDTGFVVEFEDPRVFNVVLTLEPGKMSSVFQGDKGHYIIKLEEKKDGEKAPFDEIKKDLIEGLIGMRQEEALMSYIENLRTSTDVQINEALIQ